MLIVITAARKNQCFHIFTLLNLDNNKSIIVPNKIPIPIAIIVCVPSICGLSPTAVSENTTSIISSSLSSSIVFVTSDAIAIKLNPSICDIMNSAKKMYNTCFECFIYALLILFYLYFYCF